MLSESTVASPSPTPISVARTPRPKKLSPQKLYRAQVYLEKAARILDAGVKGGDAELAGLAKRLREEVYRPVFDIGGARAIAAAVKRDAGKTLWTLFTPSYSMTITERTPNRDITTWLYPWMGEAQGMTHLPLPWIDPWKELRERWDKGYQDCAQKLSAEARRAALNTEGTEETKEAA